MIVLKLSAGADPGQVMAQLQGMGLWTQALQGGVAPAIAILPPSPDVAPERLMRLSGVAEVMSSVSPHALVDRQSSKAGAADFYLIAGPCAVESAEQIDAAAEMVARAGARYLRAGVYKPRTSPYSFNGAGQVACRWLADAAKAWGLGVVTEVYSEETAEAIADVAQVLQIGTRNMANFALLERVGRCEKPVLLKRGMAATVDEWLLAGEHLLKAGAKEVIFCERGVRGFDPQTRNLLDLGAVALLAHHYGQAVIVDPSHAVGRKDLIVPLCLAARAAGAAGVMVEAHPSPAQARSDGAQALDADQLGALSDALASAQSPAWPSKTRAAQG